MEKYLFNLPDGSHLSYALALDLKKGGSQFKWFRSYPSWGLTNITPKTKKGSPRLGLWSARKNQKILCADFDSLPEGYRSWDKFHEVMKIKYPNAYVFRSVSNKVKMFFIVEFTTSYINTEMSRYALSKLLKGRLFDSIDTSFAAMSICFLNHIIVTGLTFWLANNPTVNRVNMAPFFRKCSDHHFNIHKGKLSKIFNKFIGKSKAKEMFIRILMRQRRMAMRSGFDIPTTKFALELGVDQKTVHRWREELVELGFIKCIDETYQIKKKAKTYKAINLLRKIVIEIFTTKKQSKYDKKFIDLPESINNGVWHEVIWFYSKYFINRQQDFINWVSSLPDSDKKSRLKKAYSALKSRCIYTDTAYLV